MPAVPVAMASTPRGGRPPTADLTRQAVAHEDAPMHEDGRATSVARDDVVTGALIIQSCSWAVDGRVRDSFLTNRAWLGKRKKRKKT